MTHLSALERLSAIAERLRAEGDPWLSNAITRSGATGETLDRCLGIEGWQRAALKREQHELIGRLGAEFFQNDAAQLARAVSQYAARQWPRERAFESPPRHTIGTAAELLFRLFRLANGVPPHSSKQIRRILAEGHLPPRLNVPASSAA